MNIDDIFSASSSTEAHPMTPSHTSRSLGKRSLEGSVNRSSSKKQTMTRVDEHDIMMRLFNVVETLAAVRDAPPPTATAVEVKTTTHVAFKILKKMRKELGISNDLYLFAADLFADNYVKECFIECEEDLRLAYLERKYAQHLTKTDMSGVNSITMDDDDSEARRRWSNDFILVASVTAAAMYYGISKEACNLY
ncbi:uncharacterized protein LOC120003843 [Tripterygium wilfordii]|uniref:uncharacterized protein LOC120003843 n=1 Tax=Tripterygium wilfordii TaxID=458696 RepID=UPI0018F82D35|nr:uncharacterized protein LOC120003843 [Tripterygium wilfordii]XP_038708894.1 uncharacterized protein LOC120003843 [Tripterygium wilfordii]